MDEYNKVTRNALETAEEKIIQARGGKENLTLKDNLTIGKLRRYAEKQKY